jgi:hypothetical protein
MGRWRRYWKVTARHNLRAALVKKLEESGYTNARALDLEEITGPCGMSQGVDAVAIADGGAAVAKIAFTMDAKGALDLVNLVSFIKYVGFL